MKNLLSFLLLVLFMYACNTFESELDPLPETIQGLRPVYATNDDWQNIRSTPPRPISLLGKIYYKDSVLYVSERNEGVHIIDNTDPLFPETVGFIEIPCNGDVAIKELIINKFPILARLFLV